MSDVLLEDHGFSYEEALAEAKRCLNCKTKPCVVGCVAHMEIPSLIQAFIQGEGSEAKRIAENGDAFPEICGRVCYQEIQCENQCVWNKQGKPIKIGLIERYIGDHYQTQLKQSNQIKGSVAIIGSGPAGLACALDCTKAGLKVTVYERKDVIGGVLKFGIPSYRLPKSVVDHRIDELKKLGVNFIVNQNVGQDIDFLELKNQYDAMFIALGASKINYTNIEGIRLSKVIGWRKYLSLVNISPDAFRSHYPNVQRIIVVGGGNVAMDVVNTAARIGLKVDLIYRRTLEMMPARKIEVMEMLELGVNLHTLRDPIRISEQGNEVIVLCRKTKLIFADEYSRGVVVDDEGFEEFTSDLLIMAIGSSVRPLKFEGLEVNEFNHISVDKDYKTSLDGVYSGGDAVTGAQTVIHALASGKKAALSIIKYIEGKNEH